MFFLSLFLLIQILISLAYPPLSEAFALQAKYQELAKNISNIPYHSSEEEIKKSNDFVQNTTKIVTDEGKIENIPFHKTQGILLYYTPGSYKYGTTNFVPDYEQSIRLQAL